MSRLNECVHTLKSHIADSVEAALEYLEKIINPASTRYNDFIQIKSRFNSLQRELLLGLIDHPTFDTARNNISNAILLLADDIRESDLAPASSGAGASADKRGDILYNIPDTMQLEHEKKCAVRIAWSELLLTRDWEASADDVLKDIRVSDIMAVQLLNVDESNPFAIRTLSETVQFVDKDDFTEWIFYVKPLRVGKFPLVLRVSVIEMFHNKEYKKDIVLEEEINVQTEEVPQPVAAAFKTAHTPFVTGNATPPPAATIKAPEAPPPGAETGPSKTAARLAMAVLTTAILAASAFWGIPVLMEQFDQRAFGKARKKGNIEAYKNYLKEYPEGRYIDAARAAIDSLMHLSDSGAVTPRESPIPAGDSNSAPAPDTLPDNGTSPLPAQQPKRKNRQQSGKTPAQSPQNRDNGRDFAGPQVPPNVESPAGNTGESQPNEPMLKGKVSFLKISEFSIVNTSRQSVSFRYYKYNDAQEVLSYLTLQGRIQPQAGQWLEFVPEAGGAPIRVPLQYISNRSLAKEFVAYFTYGIDMLRRLSEEKTVRIRITDAAGKKLYEESLSANAANRLLFKGQEALKKVEGR